MPPGMRPPGLAEKDSVVSVPLSKEFALYGVYDGRSGVAPATKAVIGEINTHTIDAADRFVYSPKSDFLCRGQDGSARKARDVLLDPPGVNLSNLGKVLVFFTDEGKHWIKVRSYERDNENPVAPTVRFWTDDLETLHLLADCGHVDVLYFFDGGQERGGVRDLKFDSVAITQGTPTILKAHR